VAFFGDAGSNGKELLLSVICLIAFDLTEDTVS
jgi:hypothetical protein